MDEAAPFRTFRTPEEAQALVSDLELLGFSPVIEDSRNYISSAFVGASDRPSSCAYSLAGVGLQPEEHRPRPLLARNRSGNAGEAMFSAPGQENPRREPARPLTLVAQAFAPPPGFPASPGPSGRAGGGVAPIDPVPAGCLWAPPGVFTRSPGRLTATGAGTWPR